MASNSTVMTVAAILKSGLLRMATEIEIHIYFQLS